MCSRTKGSAIVFCSEQQRCGESGDTIGLANKMRRRRRRRCRRMTMYVHEMLLLLLLLLLMTVGPWQPNTIRLNNTHILF